MSTEIDYGEVMHRFYAGRQYGVSGPNYEDINWFEEEEAKPTREHLQTLWAEIAAEVETNKVYKQRMTPGNYPAVEQLVIALWDKIVEGDDTAVEELQARRLEIKTRYPKP